MSEHRETNATDLNAAGRNRIGGRFWIPVAIGAVFTPVAIALAALSHGIGHGPGHADEFLFPLLRPIRILLASQVVAENLVYFLQYLVYGVVLGLLLRRMRLIPAVAILLCFHVICYLVRSPLADLLIGLRDS